jgi:serine/threonine protein kinase
MGDDKNLAISQNKQNWSTMTPERWQQIKEVVHQALELAPDQRSTFVERACSSDHSLRHEVESLLSCGDAVSSSFLQSSAPQVTLAPGTKLGDYEVQNLVGSGGMGQVYRARDLRLGRDVAIKVLPSLLSADRERLRRFEQEARATAALSHPNILAVFQMGSYEGAPYLVSELLEGETLREQIQRGRLSVRKAIDFGVQIARGLAAAHEKGIVHRDLKPENLFVTKDGRIKILDFGLAKVTQAQHSSAQSAPTLTGATEPGMIMGTVGYMSPEQVRGHVADHRSDIFAFGAILYEMLTGKLAFQKATAADTMAAILSQDPPDISQVSPSTPPALQRVVHRCLEKGPDQRFQSASDLGFALQAISDSSSFTSIGGHRYSWPKGVWIVAAAVILTAVAIVVWWTRSSFVLSFLRNTPSLAPSQQAKWVQLTDFNDSAVSPTLSRDGRMLAFIRGDETFYTRGQIYVKLLPDGEPVQLTHDSSTKMNPQFSLDGSRIAYNVAPKNWDTWVVPVLGGEPRLMLPNASGLTWIDDRQLLYSEIMKGVHMALVTSGESRNGARTVYVPPQERGMAHLSAISPDHKWVLLAEMESGRWLPCRLVPFDGGSAGKPVGPPDAGCTNVAWSPDGTWMFLNSATGKTGSRFHIWRQRFPDGQPQPVTSGITDEEGIAVAPDGDSLITAVGTAERTLWVHDAKGDRQVSSRGSTAGTKFSADGRKLYYLLFGQSAISAGELHVADLGSGRDERLLPGFLVFEYHLSHDGERIVFSARGKDGHSHLWLAPVNLLSSPREFVSSVDEDSPVFDRSGYIYFRAAAGASHFLYRMKEDGTERAKVLPDAILGLQGVSPDGRWVILMSEIPGIRGFSAATVAVPLDHGTPITICHGLCDAEWTSNGRAFIVGIEEEGTLLLPVPPFTSLPTLPPGGIQTIADMKNVKGAKILPDFVSDVSTSELYALSRLNAHRNLYRIPLQ